ncbi:MAG: hypothetical protein GW803_03760, partial [Caldiserica bacterium]|nr:hypothetical protein [Caldisericota bacterium]
MIRLKNGFLVKKGNELELSTIYIEDDKIKFIFPGKHNSLSVEREVDAEGNI